MHRNNRTIHNSIEFEASAYVLHDIRQVAALVELSRNKTKIERQEILDIRQVATLNFCHFLWWVAYVHMLLCFCTVWLMFGHMCVKNVMFEVYGGECMSDRYGSFLFIATY